MICHVVLYAMKPGVTARQEADLVRRARLQLSRVPGVRRFRAGRSVEARQGVYSLALVMDFRNQAALEAYRVDPGHQRFVRQVAEPVTAQVLRFDFDTGPGQAPAKPRVRATHGRRSRN